MITADYVILIEKAEGNYGAWCPDLPGVVAVGETEDECVEAMRSAIAFHIEGLIEDGDPVPPPGGRRCADCPCRGRLNGTWVAKRVGPPRRDHLGGA